MNKNLENTYLNVLVENLTEDKTQVFGRSEYMTSIIFSGNKNDIGKIVPVKIKQSNRSTLFGEKITVPLLCVNVPAFLKPPLKTVCREGAEKVPPDSIAITAN